MREPWQIVAIEPAASVRGPALNLRVGDKVLAEVDEPMDEEEEAPKQHGSIIGFVGSLIKVSLELGGEQLLPRERVSRLKEDGLFVLWVATGPNHTLHRCEVMMQRRIFLALASEKEEDSRCPVLPKELVKGMRVWPRKKDVDDKRTGPGVIMSAASDVGLCSVTWASGFCEVVVAEDLERVKDTAVRVHYDAPRNMNPTCLMQLDLDEGVYQDAVAEGAVGD